MSKKVIRQILLIYLTTTGFFLAFFFVIWYQKLYEELVILRSGSLREIHRNIVINIINSRFTPIATSAKNIAESSGLNFAIFDNNHTIFNNLNFDFRKAKIEFKGRGIYDGKVFFIFPMSTDLYYLQYSRNEDLTQENGLKVLIQGEDVSKELFWIRVKVFSFSFLAFFVLGLIAYILVKIALRPLEDKITVLNRFIKDSTHELNTPLSVILMSIEQLERQNLDNNKFKRIKIAAKSLSQVYSDLVFYNFPNTLESEKEEFNLKNLLEERIEYFKLFFEQKKINLDLKLDNEVMIFATKNQISKLLDNLLSNAIKYNKKNGTIFIKLKDNFLSIADTGCGISKENLKFIFDRYARFNKDQGGFGIGLSLVKKICHDNNIKIVCESIENEGSVFKLSW